MKDSDTKRESAKKINEIQGKAQDIYFDLEEFKSQDTGGAAQKNVIDLIDAITSIRKRVLQSNQENPE